MERAGSIDEFLNAPVGRWVAGRTYLYWCHSTELFGFALWGRHDEADARELIRLLELMNQGGGLERPFCNLTDLSRIDSTDYVSFQLLAQYCRARFPEMVTALRRHAIVRPDGILGAVAAGFYRMLNPRHTWELFDSSADAFAWLCLQGIDGLHQEVSMLIDEVLGLSPIVHQLRLWLVEHLSEADVGASATALNLSTRSLQRHLRLAGTSFRSELDRARVRAAEDLLLHSDTKIEVIARELGWSSSAHFTDRFRQLKGESPSEFRARQSLVPPSDG